MLDTICEGDQTGIVQASLTNAERVSGASTKSARARWGFQGEGELGWDLEAGRALGYHPEDDAERFAAEIEAVAETEEDRAEAGHVGGAFATSEFERPAFD